MQHLNLRLPALQPVAIWIRQQGTCHFLQKQQGTLFCLPQSGSIV